MVFLVSSYLETVGVKSAGRKKIFCLLSDTLLLLGTSVPGFMPDSGQPGSNLLPLPHCRLQLHLLYGIQWNSCSCASGQEEVQPFYTSTQCQKKRTLSEKEACIFCWDEGSEWVSTFCFHCCWPSPVIFCDAGWRKTFSVWSVYCILCVKAWPEVSHWIYTHDGIHAIILNVHIISTSTTHSSKHSPMWSVH